MRTRPERNSPRFGANYVPSSGWFYSWLDFDPDAVRRDFADLAALGLDHVRIFPIWPWIQPNRGLIRVSAVDDVLAMIDCAAEFGLDVVGRPDPGPPVQLRLPAVVGADLAPGQRVH